MVREGGAGMAAAGSSGLAAAGTRFSLLAACSAAASLAWKKARSDCRLDWKSGMISSAPLTLHKTWVKCCCKLFCHKLVALTVVWGTATVLVVLDATSD